MREIIAAVGFCLIILTLSTGYSLAEEQYDPLTKDEALGMLETMDMTLSKVIVHQHFLPTKYLLSQTIKSTYNIINKLGLNLAIAKYLYMFDIRFQYSDHYFKLISTHNNDPLIEHLQKVRDTFRRRTIGGDELQIIHTHITEIRHAVDALMSHTELEPSLRKALGQARLVLIHAGQDAGVYGDSGIGREAGKDAIAAVKPLYPRLFKLFGNEALSIHCYKIIGANDFLEYFVNPDKVRYADPDMSGGSEPKDSPALAPSLPEPSR